MKRIHVLILVVLSLGIITAPHAYAEDVNPYAGKQLSV